MTREWNAPAYHRVSGPQTEWGRRVLSRLILHGKERVIDAGCGTGRLTAELMAMIPGGQLVAIDRSWNMLLTARANVRPDFGNRLAFVQVELPRLPFSGWAARVFGTATFRWVRDHETLFAEILHALKPRGQLCAQCGGGPDLASAHASAEAMTRRDPFARYFENWDSIWEFATP